MIGDGDEAPAFTLPAVEGGEFGEISLADYLGDDIVILAFYPADFNPCCDGETTDLDELDLFTMQKDVSIVGISGDSVYSHRAFAERYDLNIPLLADVDGTVAAAYGVAVDGEGYQCNRAVVVIDPDGTVQYAWQTDRLRELPPVDAVRRAVDGIGGASTAQARYRVGHAHYVEGRRAFTSAMGEFGEREWMMAQGDFTRAREEFDEAADQFDTAMRFGEDDEARTYYGRAEEKAGALSQAAEWLAQSASAYASGEGAEGESLRSDAERPLETARDIHEPPSPDDFPPAEDPAEGGEEAESILPDEDEPTATLDADIDATPDATADADGTETRPASATAPPESEVTPAEESSGETAAADAVTDDTADEGDGGTIDDAELEEITAEVEAQTRKAQAERATERAGDSAGVVPDGPATAESEGADSEETAVDEDLTDDGTLDLADPTEGEDEEEDDEDDRSDTGPAKDPDDDLDGGSHGVPDSL